MMRALVVAAGARRSRAAAQDAAQALSALVRCRFFAACARQS
jgi:hypothetical protein